MTNTAERVLLLRSANRVALVSGPRATCAGGLMGQASRTSISDRARQPAKAPGPVFARHSKPASPAHVDWLGAKLARLIGGGGAFPSTPGACGPVSHIGPGRRCPTQRNTQ